MSEFFRTTLRTTATLSVVACLAIFGSAADVAGAPKAKAKAKRVAMNCPALHIDTKAHQPMKPVTLPPSEVCVAQKRNGFLVPDPDCTPGAFNPTLTVAVLNDGRFRTDCVRDKATSAEKKKDILDVHENPKDANQNRARCFMILRADLAQDFSDFHGI